MYRVHFMGYRSFLGYRELNHEHYFCILHMQITCYILIGTNGFGPTLSQDRGNKKNSG